MNIIGTGLSGLVGSRLVELLAPAFTFADLSLDTGVDITNVDVVVPRIEASAAPWVLHFAAKTDVDGAERERELGVQSSSWIVNVRATEHIVGACKRSGKRLLYVSTDYVFDGSKEAYTEEDTPNPQGWYAVTKFEGEKRVATLDSKALIIRIANPYRAQFAPKPDFVAKIREKLAAGERISSPSDQLFVPTFIDDIAKALKTLIEQNASGVYHVVGSDALSPFEAAKAVARTFGLDESLVTPTTFTSYFSGRAPRPFRATLKNDKITKLGVRMATFDGGLREIKKQQ